MFIQYILNNVLFLFIYFNKLLLLFLKGNKWYLMFSSYFFFTKYLITSLLQHLFIIRIIYIIIIVAVAKRGLSKGIFMIFSGGRFIIGTYRILGHLVHKDRKHFFMVFLVLFFVAVPTFIFLHLRRFRFAICW